MGFPGGSEVKASASNAGDPGLIPGLGRSPGEGNGNPLQYSCGESHTFHGHWSFPVPNHPRRLSGRARSICSLLNTVSLSKF